MNRIWADRLIAGTKTWEEMPDARRGAVKTILLERIKAGELSPERYEEIVGENYAK